MREKKEKKLSPLNEPLIFRTLEVKIIQSKRWRSPLTRHAHIPTVMLVQGKVPTNMKFATIG